MKMQLTKTRHSYFFLGPAGFFGFGEPFAPLRFAESKDGLCGLEPLGCN